MSEFPLNSIGIIGLGMIGASVALASRRNSVADEIIGYDSSEATLRFCQEEKMVDKIMPLEAMAAHCQLIIIAVPPHAVSDVVQEILPHIGPDTVLTDVTSVKMPVIDLLEKHESDHIPFIPGHPIAGNAGSGPQAADIELFTRKLTVLTPPQGIEISDPALQRVQHFWQHLDMVVELMPADFHDLLFGYVSHLPHVMAYAASTTLQTAINTATGEEKLARFLRIGGSDPVLWCDILFHNQHAVSQALQRYIAMLGHVKSELLQGAQEQAPDEKSTSEDEIAVYTLFPRIAASCLIATVTMLERESGQQMARYSGAGFVDVASPAAEEPEGDMEHISNHASAVAALLSDYESHLNELLTALQTGQAKQLLSLLKDMQTSHEQLIAGQA